MIAGSKRGLISIMSSRTALTRGLVISGIVSLVFFAGCGGSPASNQTVLLTSLSVLPPSATVQAGGVQQFTATVTPSGANQAVTWSVSGTGCMGASCGTVDANGKYTAPATVPHPPNLSVTARSVADASRAAAATVTIIAGNASGCSPSTQFPKMGPGSVAVAPDTSGKFGRFGYVVNSYADCVSMYTIDAASGALTSVGRVATGSLPSSVAVDPSGKFAYVANGGRSGNVSAYTIDATTGALTFVGAVSAGSGPESVAVHPSSKFVYVANVDSVSMYTIDATTGALTSTGTIATGFGAISMSVDPFGRFAYVVKLGPYPAESTNGEVSMYTIGTNGALTSTGTIPTGIDPGSVTVDPSGRFAYVTNFEGSNISMYTINPTTGVLTSIGTITTGYAPRSVAVHPSGKFAYATNVNVNVDSNVGIYAINTTTGALTSIGTAAAGSFPYSIAIDPSGKFAYVTNLQSDNVSMYSIDPDSGALTLIGTIGT